jgi:hypothetical protein
MLLAEQFVRVGYSLVPEFERNGDGSQSDF